MPNYLFPIESYKNDENLTEEFLIKQEKKQQDLLVDLKQTYEFDFIEAEYKITPSASLRVTKSYLKAYEIWCLKALLTPRGKYKAYDNNYGSDLYTLVNSVLSKDAIQLEIERMVRECLMVHPLTLKVDNFSFEFESSRIFYEFKIRTIESDLLLLNSVMQL